MKNSAVIIENGEEGQRFRLHATVEKPETKYTGPTLKITSTYEDARDPNEHRVLFKQTFPSQAEYDKFANFLFNQRL